MAEQENLDELQDSEIENDEAASFAEAEPFDPDNVSVDKPSIISRLTSNKRNLFIASGVIFILVLGLIFNPFKSDDDVKGFTNRADLEKTLNQEKLAKKIAKKKANKKAKKEN